MNHFKSTKIQIHFLISTLTTSLLAMTVSSRSLANVPMQRITVLFVHEAPLPIGSLDIPRIGGATVKTLIPENGQQIFYLEKNKRQRALKRIVLHISGGSGAT